MRKGELEAEEVTRLGRESEKKEKTNISVWTDKQKETFIVLCVLCEIEGTHQSFLYNLSIEKGESTLNWLSSFCQFTYLVFLDIN